MFMATPSFPSLKPKSYSQLNILSPSLSLSFYLSLYLFIFLSLSIALLLLYQDSFFSLPLEYIQNLLTYRHFITTILAEATSIISLDYDNRVLIGFPDSTFDLPQSVHISLSDLVTHKSEHTMLLLTPFQGFPIH